MTKRLELPVLDVVKKTEPVRNGWTFIQPGRNATFNEFCELSYLTAFLKYSSASSHLSSFSSACPTLFHNLAFFWFTFSAARNTVYSDVLKHLTTFKIFNIPHECSMEHMCCCLNWPTHESVMDRQPKRWIDWQRQRNRQGNREVIPVCQPSYAGNTKNVTILLPLRIC